MAVKDVKEYYLRLVTDYLQMKRDVDEFQKEIGKYGVTEERVQALREEAENMKVNVDRLTYVMFLLDMPQRKKKQAAYHKQNSKVESHLKDRGATDDDVVLENQNSLRFIREEIEKIKEESGEPAK